MNLDFATGLGVGVLFVIVFVAAYIPFKMLQNFWNRF